MYLWYDIETTGLDPQRDRILEVAAVLTDKDLVSIKAWHRPVRAPFHVMSNLSEFIKDMHTKNGLLEDLQYGQPTFLSDVEDDLLAMIEGIDKPILAGASIQFDRAFTRHWMPMFESKLSHRMLDVSSLKMAFRDELEFDFWEGGKTAHRAMADVEEAISACRTVRASMRDKR